MVVYQATNLTNGQKQFVDPFFRGRRRLKIAFGAEFFGLRNTHHKVNRVWRGA